MTADTLIFIIYMVCGGILLAFISSIVLKVLYGSLITGLINKEAFDQNSAKTLNELGVKSNKLLQFALKNNATLKRLVLRTDTDKYYLPPQNRLKAERFYLKENLSVKTVVIIVLLFVAVYLLCDRVIPFIMN